MHCIHRAHTSTCCNCSAGKHKVPVCTTGRTGCVTCSSPNQQRTLLILQFMQLNCNSAAVSSMQRSRSYALATALGPAGRGVGADTCWGSQ